MSEDRAGDRDRGTGRATAWLRERTLWQVLGVYLAGSWVAFEVITTVSDTIPLPDWVPRGTLVLIAVGIPILVATVLLRRRSGLFTLRNAILAGGLALVSLLAIGLGVVAVRDAPRDEAVVPDATAAVPSIAVLPAYSPGEATTVGAGMNALLSTAIDGVVGWRAVSPRTVEARWDERVAGGTADEALSLEVGRATGAVYAVLPTVVVVPGELRLTAEIFDLSDLSRVAVIEDAGPPEDVTTVAERLSVGIMNAVLRGEGDVTVDLAQVTSGSTGALLAFLEGEVAFRGYRLLSARDAYERAVAIDTAFAFAHLRLAEVAQWGATVDNDAAERHTEAAARHADRLTERSAVRARAAVAPDDVKIAMLRDAAERYPDDAVLWYELGEALIHGSEALPTLDEIQSAFERAAELEPGRGATYPHLIHLLFMEEADSARVLDVLGRFREITPDVEGPYTADADPRIAPFAFDLVYGDADRRAAARAAIDTLPADFLFGAARYVFTPRLWDPFERVYLAVTEHPDGGRLEGVFGPIAETANRDLLIGYALWRGQPSRALDFATGDNLAFGPGRSSSRALLYTLHALDLPVPEEILAREFGPQRIDPESHLETVFAAGAWAVDQERWGDLEAAVETLGPRSDGGAAADVLRAYAAWRRGDVEAAIPAFEREQSGNRLVQWWLGDAYVEAGRLEDAERVFASYGWNQWYAPFTDEPLAQLRLATIYDALGRPADALEAYRYFVRHWAEAEPEMRPQVTEARRRIEEILAQRG